MSNNTTFSLTHLKYFNTFIFSSHWGSFHHYIR